MGVSVHRKREDGLRSGNRFTDLVITGRKSLRVDLSGRTYVYNGHLESLRYEWYTIVKREHGFKCDVVSSYNCQVIRLASQRPVFRVDV